MRYSFNINKVNLVNLNGVDKKLEYEESEGIPFCKIIGNFLYEATSDIDIADLAKKIHQGEVIEMSDREQKLFVEIIDKLNMVFLKRQILLQVVEVQ